MKKFLLMIALSATLCAKDYWVIGKIVKEKGNVCQVNIQGEIYQFYTDGTSCDLNKDSYLVLSISENGEIKDALDFVYNKQIDDYNLAIKKDVKILNRYVKVLK